MLAKKAEYLHNSDFFAGVAQLVEHLTCNQGVASSIPAAGTNILIANQLVKMVCDFSCPYIFLNFVQIFGYGQHELPNRQK